MMLYTRQRSEGFQTLVLLLARLLINPTQSWKEHTKVQFCSRAGAAAVVPAVNKTEVETKKRERAIMRAGHSAKQNTTVVCVQIWVCMCVCMETSSSSLLCFPACNMTYMCVDIFKGLVFSSSHSVMRCYFSNIPKAGQWFRTCALKSVCVGVLSGV